VSYEGFVNASLSSDIFAQRVTLGKQQNEELKTSSYSLVFDGSEHNSGVYFYRLSATGGSGDFIDTKRMFLVK
jgi:hypothetical protein